MKETFSLFASDPTVGLLQIAKNKRKKFADRLESSGLTGKWKIIKTKNGRGDYGLNEICFYNGKISHIISIDGARSDVQLYVSPDCPVNTSGLL